MTTSRSAVAVGLATLTTSGTVLDTWYPAPRLGTPDGASAGTARLGALELSGELGPDYGGLVRTDSARGVDVVAVRTVIADLSAPPADTYGVPIRTVAPTVSLNMKRAPPQNTNSTSVVESL